MRTIYLQWLLVIAFSLGSQGIFAQQKTSKNQNQQILSFQKSLQKDIKDAKNVLSENFVKSKTHPNLVLKNVKEETHLGIRHHHFQATYQQLPIEFGDYKVHEKNGKIYSISGKHVSLQDLNTTPTVNPKICLEEVLEHVNAQKYSWEETNPDLMVEGYQKPKGELMILPAIAHHNEKARLVYKFQIYASQPMYAGDFYVDAHTGHIVFENSHMCHASVPATGNANYNGPVNFTAETYNSQYKLENYDITTGGLRTFKYYTSSSAPGFYLGPQTSPTTTFTDDIAVQTHWSGEQTIEYFKQIHNWNSYDNNGSRIDLIPNTQNNPYNSAYTNNAVWINNKAYFGKGDGVNYSSFATLDIVGHEITHGVVKNSANLIYSGESGALNESFADIFGSCVEYFATGNTDWMMGDEIRLSSFANIRSLSNPNDNFNPDTYLGTHFQNSANASVHNNSGVQNHWFYLLAIGKNGVNDHGESYGVDGIGIEKAQEIAFRNLSVYLTANSNYLDARQGAIQAARDIYGIGSQEEISVTNAWHAVGVGSSYWASAPETCYSGNAQLVLNFDNDPENIGWILFNNATGGLANIKPPGVSYNSSQANTTVVENLNITNSGRYRLLLRDNGRDGLCCNNGNGSYEIIVGGTVVASGGIFDVTDTHQFCIDFSSGPNSDLERPTVPANFTVDANSITTTTATFDWDTSTDNGAISTYVLFCNGENISAQTQPFLLQNLTPNTAYNCEVYAVDVSGNFSVKGPAVTFTTSALPDNTPPTTPTNLNVSNIMSNSFELDWNASSDNVAVASYDVFVDNIFYANTPSPNTNINISNLNPNTTYSCYVEAIDVNGNRSASSNSVTATTLPVASSCANGTLTLTFTFDGSAKDIGWELKDAQNNYYDYGNYQSYSSYNAGDVVTETLPALPPGDYMLIVYDGGADGLCCVNGSGNFVLSDAQGTVLSGDVYECSKVQTFCVGNTNNDVFDLTPPTTSTLSATNVTTNSVELSWTQSTDNNQVLAHVFFVNGDYMFDLPPSLTNVVLPPVFTPNTYYEIFVAARDVAGNYAAISNTVSFTTGQSTATVIHEGYFENGWDGWIDGGNKTNRANNASRAYEGTRSIRVRHGQGTASSMTSPTFDLSAADSVNITFQYHTRGFEQGEFFKIRFNAGGTWADVAQFTKGVDFTTNGFYEAKITVDASTFNFGTADQFRIQTFGNQNNDRIWVDQVIITEYKTTANALPSMPTINAADLNFHLGGTDGRVMEIGATTFSEKELQKTKAIIFPNPASSFFSLKGIQQEEVSSMSIINSQGRVVALPTKVENINIETLPKGLYLLSIEKKDQSRTVVKWMKQ